MKRLHVHMAVDDVDRAIAFYARLFGTPPTARVGGLATWDLDDPPVNFAVSQRAGQTPGIDHLGIHAETSGELEEVSTRLRSAGESAPSAAGEACCGPQPDAWVSDPSGVPWTVLSPTETVDDGPEPPEIVAHELPRPPKRPAV